MIDRKSRPLLIIALGCLGWLSFSYLPAIADEAGASESGASSGWPTMPLPNPGDVSDLLKTSSENQGGASTTSNTEVTGDNDVTATSTQTDSGSQGNISSIADDVQSIPDPSASGEELQQIRPPAVIVRTYQASRTLNGSKDQGQAQGSTDTNSK